MNKKKLDRTTFLILSILLLHASLIYGQIKSNKRVPFHTDKYFNTLTEGILTYIIEDEGVYVRIDKGRIWKNLKYENYIPILSSIYVSLSTRTENGRWKSEYNSNYIDMNNVRITETDEIDISCISEIRCFEFFISIPKKIDYTKYWITINLRGPKGTLRHAHHGFYSSSFSVE